jgi:hypothetical protein
MLLDYTQDNLNLVIDIITKNLTADLLPKKWINRNQFNPMFGHCHTASGCLQKIFGTKAIKLYRALDDEDIYHWWAVDNENIIIDITADQYYSTGRKPPHESGIKSGMLGFGYRKNVLKLTDRVAKQLLSTGTPLL